MTKVIQAFGESFPGITGKKIQKFDLLFIEHIGLSNVRMVQVRLSVLIQNGSQSANLLVIAMIVKERAKAGLPSFS